MKNQKLLIDKDGEVNELSFSDMKEFKPTSEILSNKQFNLLVTRGRPIKAKKKISTFSK